MRLGISGKGGVGKTTISAVLSRQLARRGRRVIAIDCDSDPNLGANIGIGEDGAARLRPLLDQSGRARSTPDDPSAAALLADYGYPGPDGVTVLLGGRVERAGSGWTGGSHVTVRGFIQRIEDEMPGAIVVADMEAGLEHLTWASGTLRYVDLLLVVLQPTAKVLLTASRTHKLAEELGIPEICYVGSRAGEADRASFEAFAAERGGELLGLVPDDEAVRQADRDASCVIDTAPGAASVAAIALLADAVEARIGARVRGCRACPT